MFSRAGAVRIPVRKVSATPRRREKLPQLKIDEMNGLSPQLNDVQAQVLPAFRQQLCDQTYLIRKKEESKPNLLDSRLDPTFDEINTFIHTIARMAPETPPIENTGTNLGRRLFLENQEELACGKESETMLETLAQSVELIDTTILASKGSDFHFLQRYSQECLDTLTGWIDSLYLAHIKSSSQPIKLRPPTVELVKSVLSLFKLIRLFLSKSDTNTTNKPPSIIKHRMISDEFDEFACSIKQFRVSMQHFALEFVQPPQH
ncbi:hypothetical protein PtB15_10B456 [Puccinia triticina]|nr:hypothetical protein PtB15_10B456 [Puccinia triticina]